MLMMMDAGSGVSPILQLMKLAIALKSAEVKPRRIAMLPWCGHDAGFLDPVSPLRRQLDAVIFDCIDHDLPRRGRSFGEGAVARGHTVLARVPQD
jgi:hypothetical protein